MPWTKIDKLRGNDGAPGVGTAGTPGVAATVSIGTVTTGAAGSQAVVTNVGTTSAAVLNITIPRGDAGVAGTNAAATKIAAGSAATSAILLAGGSVDVTVNLSSTFPNTAYNAVAVLVGTNMVNVLGALNVAIKSKAVGSVVVTYKNTGLATITAGQTVEVIAYSP